MSEPIPSEPAVLRDVGRYRLLRILGEGGVARTWLAVDTESGKKRAVKELQLIAAREPKQIELFERECAALRELRHPQIPEFFDVLVQRGKETISLFLVQEYVEGRSLQQLLDEGRRFSSAETVAIMRSVLRPLEYLHGLAQPKYHRDIKPSNVLLRSDGDCVLVDFGAVRETLTQTRNEGSSVVGTFGYMAPEQFRGRASAATDLYALGATAFHLVSGKPPAEVELHRLKPDIRPHLGSDPQLLPILELLLEPAPEDRYSSVGALRQALDRWVEAHSPDPRGPDAAELASSRLGREIEQSSALTPRSGAQRGVRRLIETPIGTPAVVLEGRQPTGAYSSAIEPEARDESKSTTEPGGTRAAERSDSGEQTVGGTSPTGRVVPELALLQAEMDAARVSVQGGAPTVVRQVPPDAPVPERQRLMIAPPKEETTLDLGVESMIVPDQLVTVSTPPVDGTERLDIARAALATEMRVTASSPRAPGPDAAFSELAPEFARARASHAASAAGPTLSTQVAPPVNLSAATVESASVSSPVRAISTRGSTASRDAVAIRESLRETRASPVAPGEPVVRSDARETRASPVAPGEPVVPPESRSTRSSPVAPGERVVPTEERATRSSPAAPGEPAVGARELDTAADDDGMPVSARAPAPSSENPIASSSDIEVPPLPSARPGGPPSEPPRASRVTGVEPAVARPGMESGSSAATDGRKQRRSGDEPTVEVVAIQGTETLPRPADAAAGLAVAAGAPAGVPVAQDLMATVPALDRLPPRVRMDDVYGRRPANLSGPEAPVEAVELVSSMQASAGPGDRPRTQPGVRLSGLDAALAAGSPVAPPVEPAIGASGSYFEPSVVGQLFPGARGATPGPAGRPSTVPSHSHAVTHERTVSPISSAGSAGTGWGAVSGSSQESSLAGSAPASAVPPRASGESPAPESREDSLAGADVTSAGDLASEIRALLRGQAPRASQALTPPLPAPIAHFDPHADAPHAELSGVAEDFGQAPSGLGASPGAAAGAAAAASTAELLPVRSSTGVMEAIAAISGSQLATSLTEDSPVVRGPSTQQELRALAPGAGAAAGHSTHSMPGIAADGERARPDSITSSPTLPLPLAPTDPMPAPALASTAARPPVQAASGAGTSVLAGPIGGESLLEVITLDRPVHRPARFDAGALPAMSTAGGGHADGGTLAAVRSTSGMSPVVARDEGSGTAVERQPDGARENLRGGEQPSIPSTSSLPVGETPEPGRSGAHSRPVRHGTLSGGASPVRSGEIGAAATRDVPLVRTSAPWFEPLLPGGLGARVWTPIPAGCAAALALAAGNGAFPYNAHLAWIGAGVLLVYALLLLAVPRWRVGPTSGALRNPLAALNPRVVEVVRRGSWLGATEWVAVYDFSAHDGLQYSSRWRLHDARAAQAVVRGEAGLRVSYSSVEPDRSMLLVNVRGARPTL